MADAKVDTFGRQYVTLEHPGFSYSASVYQHAPAATPTDYFTILGSATNTVYITLIEFTGVATAATWWNLYLLLHSTAYASGTGAAVNAIPHDQNSPAATAAVKTWSAGLPTVGTLVNTTGIILATQIDLSIATVAAGSIVPQNRDPIFDISGRGVQPIILRGTSQYLSLNGQGTALPAGSKFSMRVEWTEIPNG